MSKDTELRRKRGLLPRSPEDPCPFAHQGSDGSQQSHPATAENPRTPASPRGTFTRVPQVCGDTWPGSGMRAVIHQVRFSGTREIYHEELQGKGRMRTASTGRCAILGPSLGPSLVAGNGRGKGGSRADEAVAGGAMSGAGRTPRKQASWRPGGRRCEDGVSLGVPALPVLTGQPHGVL